MTFLDTFHFIRPGWLLLLPAVVMLWVLLRRAKDSLRGWRGAVEPELLDALTVRQVETPSKSNAISSRYSRDVIWLVGWLLAVIAVAGPTWRPEPSPFADDPVPVMIVLKAGESMNLTDLSPSRMERARLKVVDFAQQRMGQPLGLIAYAGTAHLVLPPTRDTSVVATMASEISPQIMPKQGDDLAAAILLAEQTLGDDGGSIIVVADTIAGDGRTLSEAAENKHLPVYILGVARAETPELDALQNLASTIGARVTMMTPDSSDVISLVRSVAQSPVSVAAAGEGTRWAEAGWWLVPFVAATVIASFRRQQQVSPQGNLA